MHAYHIVKNKTETKLIIMNFGLNDREQGNVTILSKMVERLLGVLESPFPSFTVFFQLINYDRRLPTWAKENLDFLNKILMEKTQHAPLLPAKSFKTVEDCIHWTKETGEAMAAHWLKFHNRR